MLTVPVLPRSLDPLPDESLPGYILRLSYRLERTPGRIAQLTGLASPTRTSGEGNVPASAMLYLDPDTAARFARAARLSPVEAAALCMNRYSARYPPLTFGAGNYRRRAAAIARSNPWVSTNSTRYCPQCLATDAPSGHGHGWQQSWRLPIVAACTVHQQILLHLCPECRQPAHHTIGGALLPRMGDLGLHPAQCRSTVRPPGRWAAQPPACGAWLGTPTIQGQKITPDVLNQILGQQRRLLDALRPDSGTPQATARDLSGDLITLITLITMAWPIVGRDLVPPTLHSRVDDHVSRARRAVEQRRRGPSRSGIFRPLRHPPTGPATCAALLFAADQLLSHGARDLRDAITPMLGHLSDREPGALYMLRSGTACSVTLQAALRTQRGGFYAVTRTRTRPATPDRHLFAPQHVPQFLPLHLYMHHLAGLHGISAKLLRRAACFKLFELAAGSTWIDAAEFFQIPITTARSTLAFVRRWTTPNLAIFEKAVDSIASELETSADPVDYYARRQALAGWSIPAADWHVLVSSLTATPRPGRPAFYDDRKQRIASVMTWAQVTQGEHLFAPLVLAEKRDHGRSDLRCAVTAILHRSNPRNAALRAALAAYAHRLCLTIDNSQLPGPGHITCCPIPCHVASTHSRAKGSTASFCAFPTG
jgi:hypothetical protein